MSLQYMPSTIPPLLLSLVFLSLSFLVLLSPWVPLLSRLSRHGQTLRSAGSRPSPGASAVERLLMHQLPKSYFSHFYLYSTVLTSSLLLTRLSSLPLSLFLLHSLRRLYETKLVQKHSPSSTMSLPAYLLGLTFYTLAPLCYLAPSKEAGRAVGVVVFWVASLGQHDSHKRLAKLRRRGEADASYPPPPTGGLFRYSLCPHYFCETCIYLGLFLLSAPSALRSPWAHLAATPGFAVWVWTVAALGEGGESTRRAVAERCGEGTVGRRGAAGLNLAMVAEDVLEAAFGAPPRRRGEGGGGEEEGERGEEGSRCAAVANGKEKKKGAMIDKND